MLITLVTNTTTSLLGALTPAQPSANKAPALQPPVKDTGGVTFALSEKALAAVEKNADRASEAAAPKVDQAPAQSATVPEPSAQNQPIVANGAKTPAATPFAATEPTARKATVAPAPQNEPVAVDPSEEARARAHAEEQLQVSRLRSLAIAGYQDSRKLLDVIDAGTQTAETKAEAAPLRRALTAA